MNRKIINGLTGLAFQGLGQLKNAFSILRPLSEQDTDNGDNGDGQTGSIRVKDFKTVPTAYAAVNMLSGALAPLPKFVSVLRDVRSDFYEPLPDHALNTLLRNPCPFMDTELFWESTSAEYLSRGNVYYLIVRNPRTKEPAFFIPGWLYGQGYGSGASLMSRGLPVNNNDKYLFTPWPITQDLVNRNFPVRRDEVVEIHGPGYNGQESPSPIAYTAAKTMQAMLGVLDYQNKRFSSGLNQQIAIEADATIEGIDYETVKKWGEELEKTYGGIRQAGKTPILPPGYTLKSVGTISAVDLQAVELLRWGTEDLARVWSYSPWLLGIIATGTQPKQQELVEHFSRWTLQPPANKIASALSQRLLTPREKSLDYRIVLNTEAARSGTWLDQMTAGDLAATRGAILTPNEVRVRVGYPPLQDEKYNKLRQPKGSPPEDRNGDDREIDQEEALAITEEQWENVKPEDIPERLRLPARA